MMKVIVEISTEAYDWLKYGFPDEIDAKYALEAIQKGIPLPDKPTNGDMIKAMFPEIESIDAPLLKVYVMVYTKDHKCMRFDADWWDAPYEGNTNEDANRD